jgi:hypothetical protein
MAMRRLALLVATACVALALSAPAAHATGCGSVAAGKWRAKSIETFNLTCFSAREKLRRWLQRERLPRNPVGWNCWRMDGRAWMCAVGQGNAPRFTFVRVSALTAQKTPFGATRALRPSATPAMSSSALPSSCERCAEPPDELTNSLNPLVCKSQTGAMMTA